MKKQMLTSKKNYALNERLFAMPTFAGEDCVAPELGHGIYDNDKTEQFSGIRGRFKK